LQVNFVQVLRRPIETTVGVLYRQVEPTAKLMGGDVAGVSDLEALRSLSSQ